MSEKIEKVVIIGSGPAGFTAALYAGRATLNPLVFEGIAPNVPGGQLMITSEVENFPGFPKGVDGPELMDLFRKQAIKFGARIESKNITKVDLSQRPFRVSTDDDEVKAHTLIIATGANAKLLGIEKESELMKQGAGVSACATCDGAFYKDLEVGVVGGGDTAMEEAMFLIRFASKVTIIHRREGLRASKIMVQKAKKNYKINWKLNYVVDEILTKKILPINRAMLYGVKLKNTQNNEFEELKLDGLFMAIGHQPNTAVFENQLKLDEKFYLVTDGASSKTSVQGVFACGDVKDSVYRQAITAAGSGCTAAIDAERYLENEGL